MKQVLSTIRYWEWNRPNLWRQLGCHWFDWQRCGLQARQTYLVWLYLWRSGCWNGHHFEDSIQIQLCRYSYQGRHKTCHRVISEFDTVWCSYGAYFMMLKWSLFYIAQLEPILCLWYYDISMVYYYSKDTFMDVTIYTDTACYMSWNL